MLKVPKTYNPGKGYPREKLAYLSPLEALMLKALTDGKSSRTKWGVPSFKENSGEGGAGSGAEGAGGGVGGVGGSGPGGSSGGSSGTSSSGSRSSSGTVSHTSAPSRTGSQMMGSLSRIDAMGNNPGNSRLGIAGGLGLGTGRSVGGISGISGGNLAGVGGIGRGAGSVSPGGPSGISGGTSAGVGGVGRGTGSASPGAPGGIGSPSGGQSSRVGASAGGAPPGAMGTMGGISGGMGVMGVGRGLGNTSPASSSLSDAARAAAIGIMGKDQSRLGVAGTIKDQSRLSVDPSAIGTAFGQTFGNRTNLIGGRPTAMASNTPLGNVPGNPLAPGYGMTHSQNLAASMSTALGRPVSQEEVSALARTIAGEAANQSLMGQAAVANVSMNRARIASANPSMQGIFGPGTIAGTLPGFDANGLRTTAAPANTAFGRAVPGTASYGTAMNAIGQAVSPTSQFSRTAPANVQTATHFHTDAVHPGWSNPDFARYEGAHLFGNAEPETAAQVAALRGAAPAQTSSTYGGLPSRPGQNISGPTANATSSTPSTANVGPGLFGGLMDAVGITPERVAATRAKAAEVGSQLGTALRAIGDARAIASNASGGQTPGHGGSPNREKQSKDTVSESDQALIDALPKDERARLEKLKKSDPKKFKEELKKLKKKKETVVAAFDPYAQNQWFFPQYTQTWAGLPSGLAGNTYKGLPA